MEVKRLLYTGSAVVLAGGLAMGLSTGAAWAKKPKPVTGTCSSLSGGESTQSLTGCNDTPDTGGSGTSSVTIGSPVTTGTTTITWATSLTTTESYTSKLLSAKKDKCPAITGDSNYYEVKEKAKVTGGTATDLVGAKLKGVECVYQAASGGIYVDNYPGMPVEF